MLGKAKHLIILVISNHLSMLSIQRDSFLYNLAFNNDKEPRFKKINCASKHKDIPFFALQ